MIPHFQDDKKYNINNLYPLKEDHNLTFFYFIRKYQFLTFDIDPLHAVTQRLEESDADEELITEFLDTFRGGRHFKHR